MHTEGTYGVTVIRPDWLVVGARLLHVRLLSMSSGRWAARSGQSALLSSLEHHRTRTYMSRIDNEQKVARVLISAEMRPQIVF